MKALPTITAFSVAVLVAFGAFAYARRMDTHTADRYAEDLQTLLALDFRLTAEVLKARSGSVSHYDGVVQTQAALRRVHGQLNHIPQFLNEPAAQRLKQDVARSEQLLTDTHLLVERFKQENAVLRNSLRYLAVLADELSDKAAPDASSAELQGELQSLVRDELLLQGWHDRSILDRVTTAVDRLTSSLAATANVDGDRLAIAITHVRMVRERTAKVNELTRTIVEQPTVERAQTLIATYARQRGLALKQADRDAYSFFALAMFTLVSAAATVILRLSQSAQALRLVSNELVIANASLRTEQLRQQELNDLKTRFVSMTSHEFRTPLSTIMSSSELLAAYSDRWPEEKRKEHFERIGNAVHGMTRMLDGILMIGRSDAGVLEFNPREVDLVRVCARAIEAASTTSRAEHELIYEGPSGSEPVLADENLLRNVLDNLLSNAVKYSPKGGPITLRLGRDGEQVQIDVGDQGIGIPERDLDHLFETFRRGSNVGTIAGSGLGLAVVKRAVQLHGGTLSLRSEPGRGTTFSVQVPCPRYGVQGMDA